MACDRIVNLNKLPPREHIGHALEDYLGSYAERVYWREDRFYAVLIGRKSWPFRRLVPTDSVMAQAAGKEQWIEVWLGDGCVDVITRRADEATGALADGFAALVARYWKGRSE